METLLMSRIISILVVALVLLHETSIVSGQAKTLAHFKWDELVSRLNIEAVQCGAQSPESDRYKAVTEVRRRILANELSEDQWNDLLVPERLFKWRTTWLRGEPLIVQLVNPDWFGSSFEIRATPRLLDGKTLRVGRTWHGPCGLANADLMSREPKSDALESCGAVGVLAEADSKVVFDIEIRTGADTDADSIMIFSSRYWDESRVLRKAEVALKVRQVEDSTDVCKPTGPTEENCDVGLLIRPTVYHHGWWDGSMHAYLLVDLDRRTNQCAEEVGFGFVVELVKDAEVVESIDIPGWTFWESSTGCLSAGGTHMFESLLNRSQELNEPDQMKRWSLRIKSVDRLAWTAWSYSQFWKGELILPLSEIYEDERARQLGFTTIRLGGPASQE